MQLYFLMFLNTRKDYNGKKGDRDALWGLSGDRVTAIIYNFLYMQNSLPLKENSFHSRTLLYI